jgi:hypothetical protein
VNWLTSLPAGVLVVGWVAVAVATALAGRSVARRVVPAAEHDHVQGIAAPLMPALGASFAVMIAITLSSEAGYLREAQNVVSAEAAAASRLAWAASSPNVVAEGIHAALGDYLESTTAQEWRGDRAAQGTAMVRSAVQLLEQEVRNEAVRTELGTPTSTDLIVSLDALTSGRRVRLAAATRQIPALYVVTLVAAGLALVANAGALAVRVSRRTTALLVGLAAVVGLSLALLFALAAPWRGPLVVDGAPLDAVLDDLRSGFFTL